MAPVRIPVGDLAYPLFAASSPQLTPQECMDIGLLLETAQTLIVQHDEDVMALAETIDENAISHVVVRDETDSVYGLIDVEWAKGQVRRINPTVTNFAETVSVIGNMGAQPNGSYHHEFLTMDRPPLIRCSKGHFVDRLPCAIHG
jgi:hypothetical protein